jgi:serine protease Do
MSKSILIAIPLLTAATMWAQPAPPPLPPQPPITIMNPYPMPGASFLGVGVKEIDAERAKVLKLREEHGVEITNVERNSPAAKAGLQTGDVVQKYQGQRVEGLDQFIRFVRETPPGRTVEMEVIRGGSPQKVSAVLGKRHTTKMVPMTPMPPDVRVVMPDIPKAMLSWSSGYLGIEGEAVGASQLAGYFGVKDGVLVRSVTNGSAAEKAGIQPGDVITKVNETNVSAPRDITAALRSAGAGEEGREFPVTLVREKREMTVTLKAEDVSVRPLRRGRAVSQP